MAERHRSKDGSRDTDQFIKDMPETPSHQGRKGGDIANDVGTADSHARASQQGVKGVTRVTKSKQERDPSENHGGPHGGRTD
jgi:hypothetical protein